MPCFCLCCHVCSRKDVCFTIKGVQGAAQQPTEKSGRVSARLLHVCPLVWPCSCTRHAQCLDMAAVCMLLGPVGSLSIQEGSRNRESQLGRPSYAGVSVEFSQVAIRVTELGFQRHTVYKITSLSCKAGVDCQVQARYECYFCHPHFASA